MSKAKTRSDQQRAEFLKGELHEPQITEDPVSNETSERDTMIDLPTLRSIQLDVSGEGGINIGDGWARIFTLSRYGLLQVCVTTRIEEEWLKGISQDFRRIEDMSIWPEGTLPRSNPWKEPHFHKVAVCKPIWHEDIGQFQISLDGPIFTEPVMSKQAKARRLRKRMEGKRPKLKQEWSTLTYFFYPEIVEDKTTPGFWTPKRQKQGIPWKRGDRTIKRAKVRVPEFFPSDEYDLRWMQDTLDAKVTAAQCRQHLMHRHHAERPQMLVDDINVMVTFWMTSIGIADPIPR